MDRRAALVLLWFVLVVPGLFSRGYWDPDEGRYGEVAREMTQGGGLLVPRLAGQIYPEKPPLFFWVVAGFQAVAGGADAAASRLPSALSTLLTALLLLSLVGRSHGRGAGTLAAAVFLTSFLPIQMAGWVGIDAFVTLLVTAAVHAQDLALRGGRGAALRRAGLYLLLAAIVLAKGAPIAIAVIALGGYALLRDGPRGLLPRHLLWGVPLLLLLLAAWAVPAAGRAGWDYLGELTLGQASRRLVSAESHRAPVFYYLLRFPPLFLPWAVLLPAMAAVAWRDLGRGAALRVETGRYVLWFLVSFVLFSLVSGKRERYILPLFPPAAALAGIALARAAAEPRLRRLVRAPLLLVLAGLGLLGAAVAVLPFVFEARILPRIGGVAAPQLAEVAEGVRAARWILVAGGLSACVAALDGLLRRRAEAPAVPVCAAMAFLVVAAASGLLPALDRVKSYEPLVRETRALVGPGEVRWALVGLSPGPFCLALETDRVEVYEGPGRRRRALASMRADPALVLFATEPVVRNLERELGAPLAVLATRRVGRRLILAFRRE